MYRAYIDARHHKRGTRAQTIFEMHLEDKLTRLSKELRDGTYRPGRSMCFIINDPVKREVFAASFRDRVVHHLLYNYIAPVLDRKFIHDSYSCRVGKGTLEGIRRLEHHIRSCTENYTREAYILKLDISGYFMGISRDILYAKLLEMLEGEDYREKELVAMLIRLIVYVNPIKGCYRKGPLSDWDGLPPSKSLFHSQDGCGLPIGNLTSQLFSNVYLASFDNYIQRTLKIRHYGRYVDDFFLIHNSREYLKSVIPLIEDFLERNLGLRLHPDKRYLQNVNRGVPFVGAYVKPYRRYLSRRTTRALYTRFEYIPEDMTAQELRAVLNSYLGYMGHFSSFRYRRKFIYSHPWLFRYGAFPVTFSKMILLGKAMEDG